MGVLRSMKSLSLDVAGEFFVMAATLMYIKSRMLLPTDERAVQAEDEPDSDADPRWQLVEQLLEYKKAKLAADGLEDLINARLNYGERVVSAGDVAAERPLKASDKMEIWGAFNIALRRLAEKLVQGEIREENVTVADRMEFCYPFPKKVFVFVALCGGEGGHRGDNGDVHCYARALSPRKAFGVAGRELRGNLLRAHRRRTVRRGRRSGTGGGIKWRGKICASIGDRARRRRAQTRHAGRKIFAHRRNRGNPRTHDGDCHKDFRGFEAQGKRARRGFPRRALGYFEEKHA